MAKGKRRDPSPVRAGFYHGFLSLAVFGGLLGVSAGAIHLTGDPSAAGPSQIIALFETNPDTRRTARARLVDQTGTLPVTRADNLQDQYNGLDAGQAALPNLGVLDPSGAEADPARVQRASASLPTPQPGIQAAGMTINGVFVPVGKSYQQVEQNSDVSSITIVDETAETPRQEPAPVPESLATVTISTPSEANIRAFSNPEDKPVIALIVGGLGTSARQTNAAIDDLPPEVTLSFIADASPSLIRRAREKGHEVLLEVPMEAYERGRTLPHSQTLLAGGSADDNRDRLDRLLSRSTEFFGVINHDGEKFADADSALAPILERLEERGLAFFRHGSTPSKSFDLAADQQGIIYAAANDNIDTQVEAEAIERRLQQLEEIAKSRGAALGTGFAYPLTMDIIVAWSRRLETKGILLAPASAVPSVTPSAVRRPAASVAAPSPSPAPIEAPSEAPAEVAGAPIPLFRTSRLSGSAAVDGAR